MPRSAFPALFASSIQYACLILNPFIRHDRMAITRLAWLDSPAVPEVAPVIMRDSRNINSGRPVQLKHGVQITGWYWFPMVLFHDFSPLVDVDNVAWTASLWGQVPLFEPRIYADMSGASAPATYMYIGTLLRIRFS